MKKEHLLIIALACGSLPSMAAIGSGSSSSTKNVTIDSLQWTLVDSTQTATLYRYGKKGDTAIIPETVEYGGKSYQVVAIAAPDYSRVFYDTYENIKHVSLPKTLRIVGYSAFSDCNSLKEINLPETVDSIGNSAFLSCRSLKSITIPSKVKVLGESSIRNCSNLEEINLPEGLTTILQYALSDDTKLRQLTIPSTVTYLGDYALNSNYSLNMLTVNASIVPQLGKWVFSSCNNLHIIYVPEGFGTIYHDAEGWKDYIIAPGKGLAIDIDLTTPGELGNEILKLTENISDVNILKIKGKLNDDDIYNIQNRMPNLIEIDLSEVDMKSLPSSMFYNREAIRRIVLPNSLVTIGENAMQYCHMLESITIPKGVTNIGNRAFYDCSSLTDVQLPTGLTYLASNCFYNCTSITSITLPESVTSIGEAAFANCSNLQNISLSKSLTSINYGAFSNCTRLTSIELPATLQSIGGYAFENCTGLEKITIPESVTKIEIAFYNCYNLKEITCLAMQPPLVGDNNPLYYVNMEGKTLYVPSITINSYKQTRGWDAFTNIKPLDYFPGELHVTKDFTIYLPDNLTEKDKTKVDFYNDNGTSGHLTVNGNSTLSMSNFDIAYDNYYNYYYGRNEYTSHATLINKANMRADNVSVNLKVRKNKWNFISLPFDTKVSDIKCLTDDTQWVIRKYSGEARAKAEKSNTWQDMTADSTLHANEGYILQCNNSDSWDKAVVFQFTAQNNGNKNRIFASANQKVAMKEYVAEFAHNRSWNLLGNPYPAYFDTRYLDFTAPITVWNMYNSTYEAYSPVDDSYILTPGEAFFVQRPVDQAEITFDVEGRQHNFTVRTIEPTTRAKAIDLVDANREVYNLSLSNGETSDRTRIVINPKAEMSYNAAYDAGKMMSERTLTAQLYTIGDDIDYAINERPLGDGIVHIGVRFAKNGTYTLALEGDKTAILTDHQEGKQVELNANGYTFTAKAGECRDRFTISWSNGGVTGINGIYQDTEPSNMSVFSLDGKMLKGNSHINAHSDMPAGTYIMKKGNKAHKVNVNR